MMIHPDFVAKLHNGSKVEMRVPVSFGVYGLGGGDGSGRSLWGRMRLGFQSWSSCSGWNCGVFCDLIVI